LPCERFEVTLAKNPKILSATSPLLNDSPFGRYLVTSVPNRSEELSVWNEIVSFFAEERELRGFEDERCLRPN
jgi:hypothetical protein